MEQQFEAEGDAKSGANSDVDEFFALLERINATEKQIRALRRVNSSKLDLWSKAAWRPSFEWEDFRSAGNGPRDVVPFSTGKASQGISMERGLLPNDNCVKSPRLSLHQNNVGNREVAREKFDLNLPLSLTEL